MSPLSHNKKDIIYFTVQFVVNFYWIIANILTIVLKDTVMMCLKKWPDHLKKGFSHRVGVKLVYSDLHGDEKADPKTKNFRVR